MNRYEVCVSQVMCAFVEVEAANDEEAKELALREIEKIDREEWCNGHRGTEQVESVETLPKDGVGADSE